MEEQGALGKPLTVPLISSDAELHNRVEESLLPLVG